MAVHAHAFDDGGCISCELRSELLLSSVKMVSVAFFFIMALFLVVDVLLLSRTKNTYSPA